MESNQCLDCGQLLACGPNICTQCRGSNTAYFANITKAETRIQHSADDDCFTVKRGED